MAQQQFSPVPDVTTHSDATTFFNSNFQDSEDRLTDLESFTGSFSDNVRVDITGVESSNGILTIDTTLAYNYSTTLTEQVTGLSLEGEETGRGGSLIIRQDEVGGWGIDNPYPEIGGWFPSISGMAPSGEGVAVMSWFYDGQDYLTSISDIGFS
jgi:hypothetical protein